MTTSFQDRLSRIGHTPDPVDMIGQGNASRRAPVEVSLTPEPKSFGARYRNALLLNFAFGFTWMFAVGFCLRNFGAITAYIDAAPYFAENALAYTWTIGLVCGFSVFGMVWWVVHPLFMPGSLGFPPISLLLGTLLGLFISLGPLDVLSAIAQFHPHDIP